MTLTDDEIRATQARHPTDNNPMDFAHAIIAATIDKLAQGVSVEPDMWSADPADEYALVQGYTVQTLTTAIAAAHLAGRKSVHDSCVDVWKGEFLAAARVQALEEAALMAEGHYGDGHRLAEEIRALKGTP